MPQATRRRACAREVIRVAARPWRYALTFNETYRTMCSCVVGPAGWLIADWLTPPMVGVPNPPGAAGTAEFPAATSAFYCRMRVAWCLRDRPAVGGQLAAALSE